MNENKKTLRIGIALDPWKLKFFESVLTDAGYTYTVTEGREITSIMIDTDNPNQLVDHIKNANNKARASKEH